MSCFIAKFLSFIGFDEKKNPWCTVQDGDSVFPAILLQPSGILTIPKKNDRILAKKGVDADYLYVIGSLDNPSMVNIDNEGKKISINNCNEFSVEINGAANIKANSVTIDSTDIKIGSNGATFTPLTLEDLPSLLSPSPGTGGGAPTRGQITLSGSPKVIKTKVE